MPVVAAIFDLDGTLVTFNLDIREWRKALLQLMVNRGFDTSGLDPSTPTQQILDAAKAQAGADGPGKFDSLRRDSYSILDAMELEGTADVVLLPGAKETLAELKSKGVRICLLTNSGRAAANLTLTRSGLMGSFEFVLTRDDTETMKPRPEGMLLAVRALGVPPGGVYYVGDSVLDIRAAKQAGVKAVSVATGNYTAERLRDEGADFVISALSELPKVLGV